MSIADDPTGVASVWTVPQAAKILQISKTRAYALIREGRLPAIRLGERQVRVPVEALNTLISGTAKGR